MFLFKNFLKNCTTRPGAEPAMTSTRQEFYCKYCTLRDRKLIYCRGTKEFNRKKFDERSFVDSRRDDSMRIQPIGIRFFVDLFNIFHRARCKYIVTFFMIRSWTGGSVFAVEEKRKKIYQRNSMNSFAVDLHRGNFTEIQQTVVRFLSVDRFYIFHCERVKCVV